MPIVQTTNVQRERTRERNVIVSQLPVDEMSSLSLSLSLSLLLPLPPRERVKGAASNCSIMSPETMQSHAIFHPTYFFPILSFSFSHVGVVSVAACVHHRHSGEGVREGEKNSWFFPRKSKVCVYFLLDTAQHGRRRRRRTARWNDCIRQYPSPFLSRALYFPFVFSVSLSLSFCIETACLRRAHSSRYTGVRAA